MGPIEATSQSVKLVQICSNQFDHVQSYLWKARSQHLATVHSSVTDFQKHCLQVLGRRIQPESMAHVSHRTVRISVVDVWNYTNIYKDMRTNIHLISTLSGTKPLVLDKLNTRIQPQVLPETTKNAKMLLDVRRTSAWSATRPCTVASSLPSLASKQRVTGKFASRTPGIMIFLDHLGGIWRRDVLRVFASFRNHLT